MRDFREAAVGDIRYGLEVFPQGFAFHERGASGRRGRNTVGGGRAAVREFSGASRKRLEMVAANGGAEFRSLVTLTYHARAETWESGEKVNRRIAARSKEDLSRFIDCVRRELGAYLWVMEFQKRGVVHFHLLCAGEPSAERCTLAWVRATGELDDAAAVQYAVQIERIEHERVARWYVGRYLGKGKQKQLPEGVVYAGRWWATSRGLELIRLREVVTSTREHPALDRVAVRVVRAIRRWLSRKLGFRVRSGKFLDWGGKKSAAAAEMIDRLVEYFGRDGGGAER
jgi:hypothetical protein